jgi:hypothetical protein
MRKPAIAGNLIFRQIKRMMIERPNIIKMSLRNGKSIGKLL